jgi:uncharacterized membrane protein
METTESSHADTNVGRAERWVSAVAGGVLAAYGLKRRSIAGIVVAALGGALVHRAATGRCMVYESLGITTPDEPQGDQVSVPYGRGTRVEKTVTIDASPSDLYTFWRNFENLPRFMNNLESVTMTGPNRSRWVAKGPLGVSVEWDAEIINEIPNELIGWRSIEGSTIDNAGSVQFKPATGGRGTVVKIVLRYDPPAGVVGATVSKLFGEDPEYQVQEDLRRFKRIIETGELPTIDGQSTGRN